LGRSLSAPCKLIGESTKFEKKAISGGFGGTMGGGRFKVELEMMKFGMEVVEYWKSFVTTKLTKMIEF
jgi:hypothetical protein